MFDELVSVGILSVVACIFGSRAYGSFLETTTWELWEKGNKKFKPLSDF